MSIPLPGNVKLELYRDAMVFSRIGFECGDVEGYRWRALQLGTWFLQLTVDRTPDRTPAAG